jgi:putative nucleotidyltransferase with HDIG domain
VLVVDDENRVRDLTKRWLQARGYAVSSASDANEALGLMQRFPPAVALCDVRMPGHDGFWLAAQIRQHYPETAVIMASGIQDADTAAASMRNGVVEYLTKPFGRVQLQDAVVRGIEWHRSARDSRGWRERLEHEVASKQARLVNAIETASIDSDAMLDELLTTLTTGDPEAYAHARRVARLSVAVAEELKLSKEEVAHVRRGALLHDLGKLAMPEAVLRKPAPLTAEEQSIVRRHPQLGSDLIGHLPFLEEAAEIVRQVHERPDGFGYPTGLKAGDILTSARIVAAVDAYDTMIGSRAYRGALSGGDALVELDRCTGTQFDPQVVAILKRLVGGH